MQSRLIWDRTCAFSIGFFEKEAFHPHKLGFDGNGFLFFEDLRIGYEEFALLILGIRGFGEFWEEMFYGAPVWDPWLIVAQIVCLQCLYYLTLGTFMSVFVWTRVSRMTLVYFFDYETVSATSITGWSVIVSFLLTSLASTGYMVYLIERSRKCLDFSATIYIVHLLVCIIYGGWPYSITWWIVNITGLAVMASISDYLCRQREQQEISLPRYRPAPMQAFD